MKTASQELVTIASFQDYLQAGIAKSALDSAGIDCWVADDVIVTLNWFYSRLYGGVKLRVREKDAEEALSILEASAEDGVRESRPTRTEPVSRLATFGKLFFAILLGGYLAQLGFSAVGAIQALMSGGF